MFNVTFWINSWLLKHINNRSPSRQHLKTVLVRSGVGFQKAVVCARACGKSVVNSDTFPDWQLSQELLKVRRDALFFNYCVDQSSPDTKVPQNLYRVRREESPHSNEQSVSPHSHSAICTTCTPTHTHCCLCLKQGQWCAMTNFDCAPNCRLPTKSSNARSGKGHKRIASPLAVFLDSWVPLRSVGATCEWEPHHHGEPKRRIAGFVIPWMLSRRTLRWSLAPPLPRPLPPFPRPDIL